MAMFAVEGWREARRAYLQAAAAAWEAHGRLRAAERVVLAEIAPALGVEPLSLTVGTWSCPSSPLGVCVYEVNACEDECLYCGHPEERK